MSEIRLNEITGDWVIVAPERAKRPADFGKSREVRKIPPRVSSCPFCPGNEENATDERFRISGNHGTWLTRSVVNKFSALSPEYGQEPGKEPGKEPEKEPVTVKGHKPLSGVGLHEVIIDTPRHDLTTALLPASHVGEILRLYLQRFCAFYADRRIKHVIVYKNHGEEAGTSLEHPHSQIVGTPVVPGQVESRMHIARKYHSQNKTCLYCDTRDSEIAAGSRVVGENRSFVAFVPYASLSPYHIWIFPRSHHSCFASISERELMDLATILQSSLGKLYTALGNPSFNYVLRSLGPSEGNLPYFHWYLAIVPRINKAAGFELGTGMYINSSSPEISARTLREAPELVRPDPENQTAAP